MKDKSIQFIEGGHIKNLEEKKKRGAPTFNRYSDIEIQFLERMALKCQKDGDFSFTIDFAEHKQVENQRFRYTQLRKLLRERYQAQGNTKMVAALNALTFYTQRQPEREHYLKLRIGLKTARAATQAAEDAMASFLDAELESDLGGHTGIRPHIPPVYANDGHTDATTGDTPSTDPTTPPEPNDPYTDAQSPADHTEITGNYNPIDESQAIADFLKGEK